MTTTYGPLSPARHWAGTPRLAPEPACGHDGGDVFAARETPYGRRLLIADVRGKGDAAADGARALLDTFRRAAGAAATLGELSERLDEAMRAHAAQHPDITTATEHFATAVLGELDHDNRSLRLLNHGHPAPLLLHSGTVSALEPVRRGLPLGLPPEWRDLARTRRAGASTVYLPPGSTLLLLTDGVTEARDGDGTFYDPISRLTGLQPTDPGELLTLLRQDVARHRGRRTRTGDDPAGGRPDANVIADADADADADDMALLALRP